MGGGCAGSASHLLEDIRLRLFAGRRLATACRSSVRGQQAVDQYRCLAAGLHGRSQSRLGMAAEGTARGPWLGQGCAREFLNCQPAALYFIAPLPWLRRPEAWLLALLTVFLTRPSLLGNRLT